MEPGHERAVWFFTSKNSHWRIAITSPAILKVCVTCKLELPTSDFRRKASRPDGLSTQCKGCAGAYDNKRYAEHKTAGTLYFQRHPEKSREQCRKYYQRNKEWFVARDRRKEATLKGARVETVSSVEVYLRDGWNCGLCGGVVLFHLTSPHPLSPSLDHVQPLSRGGDHSYANTQLAHLRCNISKGNRV